MTKDRIFTAPIQLAELRTTFLNYLQLTATNPAFYSASEFQEFASFVQRADVRVQRIDNALAQP